MQQYCTQAHVRRLRQRTPRVGHRAFGGTSSERPRCRRPQLRHHLCRPGRLADEQMRAHRVGVRTLRGKQSCRLGMPQAADRFGDVVVHRRPHDRVHEPQRRPGLEYSDPGPPVRRRSGVRQTDAGQGGGVPQRRSISQDRGRPGKLTSHRPEPCHPQRHRPRDRPGAQVRHPPGGCLVGLDAVRAQFLGQFTHQKGITAAHRVAHRHELLGGCGSGYPGQQCPHRRLAQRTGGHDALRGDLLQPRKAIRRRPGGRDLSRAPGNRQRNRQARQAVSQVQHETQRRLIGPLQVVNGDQHRRGPAGIHGQPVQAVHHRERRIARGRRGTGVFHGRQREACRTGQQRIPLRLRSGGEQPLEQLPRHPEREVALKLPAAARQDAHSRQPGPFPGLAKQGTLADPCGTGDHQHTPVACPCAGEQAIDPAQLTVALEQVIPHRLPRTAGNRRLLLDPVPPRGTGGLLFHTRRHGGLHYQAMAIALLGSMAARAACGEPPAAAW